MKQNIIITGGPESGKSCMARGMAEFERKFGVIQFRSLSSTFPLFSRDVETLIIDECKPESRCISANDVDSYHVMRTLLSSEKFEHHMMCKEPKIIDTPKIICVFDGDLSKSEWETFTARHKVFKTQRIK